MSSENECSSSVDEIVEECYTEFYMDTLDNLYDFRNPQLMQSVYKSLQKLNKIKHSERKPDAYLSKPMDYSLECDRAAYVYRYCILYSKMINFHFKEFLKQNVVIRNKILKMKKLRICVLGGKAAIEAVAIVKVISDLLLREAPKKRSLLNLQIIIVDKCSGWKTESLKILTAMKEHTSLNITDNISLDVHFLKRNILQNFDIILRNIMKKSNLVTLVKFVSEDLRLNSNTWSEAIENVIKNITDSMGIGGCFFVVDNNGGDIPRDVRSNFLSMSLWKNIFRCYPDMPHTLENDTRLKLAKVLPFSRCSRETRVFSRAWIKTEPEFTKVKLKGNYSKEYFKKEHLGAKK